MDNYLKYLQKIQSSKNFRRKVDYIEYNFSKYFNNNNISVLEIGPGLGEFIYYLNKLNINTIDIIDQDKYILKNIQQKYKVRQICCSDILTSVIEKQYDIIFLLQVLEHIPKNNYQKLLNNLFKHLNKNGKIIITVPNGGNPFNIVERYSDLTHEILFTENSLKELPNYCNLPSNTITEVQPYNIPTYSLINQTRIIFQKLTHLIILFTSISNGGVFSRILTPNISLIITKK
ncbi:MAG: methyltransferase domain-containing protein [Candidatus Shapirobacteria bacterium]|jgi:2-polyprenyl-3-methyl-5-hydroxy-6-metoxy-1,4-benzoquinol methylase